MKVRRILLAIVLITCVFICACLVCFLSVGKSGLSATKTAQSGNSLSTDQARMDILTVTTTPIPTKIPSLTLTLTNTRTLDPSITPPTPTRTPTVTKTPRPTRTFTRTRTPTKTRTPLPSNTPLPEYMALLGNIWSGVKVYYGTGVNKAYGFEILGGSEDCPSMPSGRGIKVLFPDGTEEWKDRNYLVLSGIFFVRKDDPALRSVTWYEYTFCP